MTSEAGTKRRLQKVSFKADGGVNFAVRISWHPELHDMPHWGHWGWKVSIRYSVC